METGNRQRVGLVNRLEGYRPALQSYLRIRVLGLVASSERNMSGEAKASAITNFASGAAAGVAQIVVGFPFDTIKGMCKRSNARGRAVALQLYHAPSANGNITCPCPSSEHAGGQQCWWGGEGSASGAYSVPQRYRCQGGMMPVGHDSRLICIYTATSVACIISYPSQSALRADISYNIA